MAENFDFTGVKILVVDDEEFNWLLMKNYLDDTQAIVSWARVGQEAVDLIDAGEKYDMILMDMSMPVLDGYDTTRLIRKVDSKVPVIAQTAFAMDDEKAKCIEAGCDDYLSKPICMSELLKTVRKYVRDES